MMAGVPTPPDPAGQALTVTGIAGDSHPDFPDPSSHYKPAFYLTTRELNPPVCLQNAAWAKNTPMHFYCGL